VNPSNQLRLVTSLRRDYYQIPNTPGEQTADMQREADAFLNLSWVHTVGPRLLLTVSPFFHFNGANFDGGPNDPIRTTDHHSSYYAGGQTTLSGNFARNEIHGGFYGFGQHEEEVFGLSSPSFRDTENIHGNLEVLFLDEKFKVTSWLTLMGGVRQTHFSGSLIENDTSPRAGAAVTIPHLNWVFRGFYGHFYQAPPLITASGPLLQLVTSQNLAFIPLHGERDEEHQFGVTIPIQGWTLDADNFKTRATNFFDHNNVGNSNIFFPLSIQGAVIQGWELTLRSPKIAHHAQIHLAYSNQVASARGPISGGLTDFAPPSGFFPLDHDQRNTLNVGADVSLPWRSFAAGNVSYGSGLTDNDGPAHLAGHTTLDLSLGKSFGERFSVSVNGLNLTNRHLLIDNSLTFGGTHWNNPREIYVELRYRFHY
jgi:outer membrane receptor protein involved in Fe transport